LEGADRRLLRRLLAQARATNHSEDVIGYADRYLRTDPDDEVIHEALMRSHVLLGNRTAALRHFQRYAEQLRQDLATQPSRRLRLLSEQIARES
jgi:DNA-binding SARP family transcriptional activator